MAKILKSKFFLGALCLLLAAAIAFLLLPRLYESKSDTVQAVKLTQDVPVGTILTSAMLTTVEVGAYGLPDSVLLDKGTALGKIAYADLYAGEFLTNTRLITEEEYAKIVEDQTKGLSDGYCLVTVAFPTTSAAVASILRGGHIVDVHEAVENEDKSISVNKILSSMYVYDVLNSDLESLNDLDKASSEPKLEDDATDYDLEPAYVVFRCTETQAQSLIRLERLDAMHLTLQRTGE